jgi:hypothetical protein
MHKLPVQYVWNNRRHTVDGKCLRGVTDTIKAYFFPSYSYRKARKGTLLKNTTVKRLKGKALGNKLDRDMMYYVEHGELPTAPAAESKQIITFITSRKLTLVHAQLAVADLSLRTGTCLDLVAFDGKCYIIIELKTGYENYKLRFSQQMLAPFENFTNCPKNQHLLQLLLSTHLFKATYPEIYPRSELWYVQPNQIEIVKMPTGMTIKVNVMIRQLSHTKHDTVKDRIKIKRSYRRKNTEKT